MNRARAAALAIAASAIVVVGAAQWSMTPSVGDDASWGVLASEQVLAGRSDSVLRFSVADPADLGHDRTETITWWAPGQQEAVYALRRLGLSLGHAIKALVIGAWVIGTIAWSLYFVVTLSDRRLAPWLVACFTLFRLSHYSGFEYMGGETLLWAAWPSVVLLNLAAMRRIGGSLLVAAAAGFLVPALVLAKYSAAFLAVGVGVAWGLAFIERRVSVRQIGAWIAGAIAGSAVVWWGGLAETLSGPTPAKVACGIGVTAAVSWSATGPLWGLTDLREGLSTLLGPFGLGQTDGPWLAAPSLALGALFLAWHVRTRGAARSFVVGSSSTRQHAWQLAVAAAAAVTIGLAIVHLRACASYEGRHQALSAFLLLPFLVDALADRFSWTHGTARVLTVVMAMVCIGVPTVYGASALAVKTFVRMPRLAPGIAPNGLRLDFLSSDGGPAAFARDVLAAHPAPILATSTAGFALAAADHRVMFVDLHARPLAVEHGNPPGGIALLLLGAEPPSITDAVRGSFIDIQHWDRVEHPAMAGMVLWIGH